MSKEFRRACRVCEIIVWAVVAVVIWAIIEWIKRN